MQICKRVAGGGTRASRACPQPGKQGGSQAGHWSGLLQVYPALFQTPDPSMWHSGHLGDLCKPLKPSSTLTSVCFVHPSAIWSTDSLWGAPGHRPAETLPPPPTPVSLGSVPASPRLHREWLKAKTLTLGAVSLLSPLSPFAAGGPQATCPLCAPFAPM